MKDTFTQHVPNYCDTEPVSFEFDTQSELLSHSIVSRYLEHEKFNLHFCKSDNYLMVQNEIGNWWWVVGRVNHMDLLDLPLCLMKKTEEDLENERIERERIDIENKKRYINFKPQPLAKKYIIENIPDLETQSNTVDDIMKTLGL